MYINTCYKFRHFVNRSTKKIYVLRSRSQRQENNSRSRLKTGRLRNPAVFPIRIHVPGTRTKKHSIGSVKNYYELVNLYISIGSFWFKLRYRYRSYHSTIFLFQAGWKIKGRIRKRIKNRIRTATLAALLLNPKTGLAFMKKSRHKTKNLIRFNSTATKASQAAFPPTWGTPIWQFYQQRSAEQQACSIRIPHLFLCDNYSAHASYCTSVVSCWLFSLSKHLASRLRSSSLAASDLNKKTIRKRNKYFQTFYITLKKPTLLFSKIQSWKNIF